VEKVLLTWDDVYVQFNNLVKWAAGKAYSEKENVDKAVSPQDLYQIGLLKLYDCFNKYNHLTMEEFKAVFTKALLRAVRRGAKYGEEFDYEDAITGEEGQQDQYIEQLYFQEGLQQLREQLVSPLAVAILSELIEPSPRTIFEVWADSARKRQLKENQNKEVNLSKRTEVKMKHIRKALGITPKQFDKGISEIRRTAQSAFVLA